MKTGTELIAEERQRQMDAEGWTPEHDDGHSAEELIDAAVCYIRQAVQFEHNLDEAWWPWDEAWWKPSDDPIRNLVKAGALIAAEIDRLQRLPRP